MSGARKKSDGGNSKWTECKIYKSNVAFTQNDWNPQPFDMIQTDIFHSMKASRKVTFIISLVKYQGLQTLSFLLVNCGFNGEEEGRVYKIVKGLTTKIHFRTCFVSLNL